MSDKALYYFLVYGVDMLSILFVVLALWRPRMQRSSWLWVVAALLAIAFIVRTIFFAFHDAGDWCFDFRLMWGGGNSALQGKDPYTLKGYQEPSYRDVPVFHYPPYALPFFKLVALVPFPTAAVIWTGISVLICLSLGLLARQALIAQDGEKSTAVTSAMAALLTAPVLLSISTNLGIRIGQSSFLVFAALLGALIVQGGRKPRPALTALFLTLASIKPQMLVPFLLLFLRRRELKTYFFLGVFVTALLLAAGSPLELPRNVSEMFAAMAAARAPGSIDDYSMSNRESMTMIGFDHLFARVGIQDRGIVSALSYLCMFVIGGWVAYLVTSRREIRRGACCSLVCLYSLLFIYHRYYDLVLLILPLIYSASRMRTRSWPARWCYAWVVTAILLSLNAPYGEFYRIQIVYPTSGLLRTLVLPSVLYLILSAMAALVVAGTLEARLDLLHPAGTPREGSGGVAGGFAGEEVQHVRQTSSSFSSVRP